MTNIERFDQHCDEFLLYVVDSFDAEFRRHSDDIGSQQAALERARSVDNSVHHGTMDGCGSQQRGSAHG